MNKENTNKFRAAQALHQTLPKLDRLMRQTERRVGATGGQLSALAAISEFGRDRLHLLAKHEGVSRPTMSRLVNALEARGLIEKQTDEVDRRAPRLSITQVGRSVLVESCDERTRILMALMENLTNEECATLNECLRKLGPHSKN
ncbi:MarR family winged helix-turn-helix transcriptional regulator [Ruegeria sp. HKCCD8929]|uniref:MarR family winged helix-turn-helix transcriptional regulator n=1 Tax=Ruegeria sp. HKCCD8929 TaxID=2683006 RepID=UPI001488A9B0|nr:MarR family transcriptional regulator [Ruegeria sp. HKCCD8929]